MKNEYLKDSVEIIVENLDKDVRLYVNTDFGLLLRKGDVLLFGSSKKKKPSWIIDALNYETFIDGAITLRERTIDNDTIRFYAQWG
jgi:hypothetical protein